MLEQPVRHEAPTNGPMSSASVERSARWVRVKAGGVVIADSKQTLLLIQYGPGRLPTYYFPLANVRMDMLEQQQGRSEDGQITHYNLKVGDLTVRNAAWGYDNPAAELADLASHVTFTWSKEDQVAWFEEEEQVFVHARDPHKRIDVLASSRHVRVVIDNVVVAESHRPHLLFETGLPTRYYLPAEEVRTDLLEKSSTTSRCPYKGSAVYWSAKMGSRILKDIAWSYPDPILECQKIRGLMAFYNERVDLYVDGELQVRPTTPWSKNPTG